MILFPHCKPGSMSAITFSAHGGSIPLEAICECPGPLRGPRSPNSISPNTPRCNCVGRRIHVSGAPMTKLEALVADVLRELRLPDVSPKDCQLTLDGKPIPLDTPLRFANITPRSKLVLKTGELHVG